MILKVLGQYSSRSGHHHEVATVTQELQFVEQVLKRQGFQGLISDNEPLVTAAQQTSRNKTRLVWKNVGDTLLAFLCGTIDVASPIALLRGQADVLRKIFTLTCEEFWMAHIVPMVASEGIPLLLTATEAIAPKGGGWQSGSMRDGVKYRDTKGQYLGGAPAAVLEQHVEFPKPLKITMGKGNANPYFVKDTEDDTVGHLYVNMLPFDLKDKSTLPDELKQYWPIIALCCKRMTTRSFASVSSQHQHCAGYLTIDERPVRAGNSQRRHGVHCESPSVIAVPGKKIKKNRKKCIVPNFIAHGKNGCYTPGAEHHWGRGLIMRHDALVGGIYMCSNVDNSTAVWNQYINDRNGEIIGPHGDLEHVRHLLGPPSKLLKKGELVWMTDKTPHESVPLQCRCERQYFRLVCGEVSAWFSSHSTRNPNFKIPSNVRIVHENKFKMNMGKFPRRWLSGSVMEISMLNEEKRFSMLLHKFGLGHLCERWVLSGIDTIEKLYYLLNDAFNYRWPFERMKLAPSEDDFVELMGDGWYYFEARQIKKLFSVVSRKLKYNALEEIAKTVVDIAWERRTTQVIKGNYD